MKIHRFQIAGNFSGRIQLQRPNRIAIATARLDQVGQLPVDAVHNAIPAHFLAGAEKRSPEAVVDIIHHRFADLVAVLRRTPFLPLEGRFHALFEDGLVARHDLHRDVQLERLYEILQCQFIVIWHRQDGMGGLTNHIAGSAKFPCHSRERAQFNDFGQQHPANVSNISGCGCSGSRT
jgi:hypothetical protein